MVAEDELTAYKIIGVGGGGIFGTIMDAWQRPLDDVGAAGRDRGRGAKYLLVPPGYDSPLLPKAPVYEQRTNYGFAVICLTLVLRP